MCNRMLSVATAGLVATFMSAAALAQDVVAPGRPPPSARPDVGVPIAVEILEPSRYGTVPPGPTYRVSARNLSGKAIVTWGVRVYAPRPRGPLAPPGRAS